MGLIHSVKIIRSKLHKIFILPSQVPETQIPGSQIPDEEDPVEEKPGQVIPGLNSIKLNLTKKPQLPSWGERVALEVRRSFFVNFLSRTIRHNHKQHYKILGDTEEFGVYFLTCY